MKYRNFMKKMLLGLMVSCMITATAFATEMTDAAEITEDTDMLDTMEVTEIAEETVEPTIDTEMLYTPSDFMFYGAIQYNGYRYTWYSEKVLPGGGLAIPGRCVDENGYVCDENGYICIASCDLGKGTVVDTPFGKQGKVYDCNR